MDGGSRTRGHGKYSPFVNCFDLSFPGLAEEAVGGDFQVTFGSDTLEPELVCGGGMNLEILMENRLCS